MSTTPSQTPARSTTDTVTGPTPQTVVPATPAPLTLEQQHITNVKGIVPTLDRQLDSKTIVPHASTTQYNHNSKVGVAF